MLVLTRRQNEVLVIGDIVLVVLGIQGSTVSLGLKAPQNVRFRRDNAGPAKEVGARESKGGLLVLSRTTGEQIFAGASISITVIKVGTNRVRIGVEAPPTVPIDRHDNPDGFIDFMPVAA